MELVTGAMGSLLPKLGQLLKEEYGLHKGVKDQVISISRELESMHAALHRVGEVPPAQLDEPVKLWARDVREVSYDMEDIIDTFLVRVNGRHEGTNSEAHGFRCILERMVNLYKKIKACREIAVAVKGIHKKLQEVADRRARNMVDGIIAKPAAGLATIDPRLQALYKKSSELVGIDGPMDELIKMLALSLGDDIDVHMPAKKRKMDVHVSIKKTKFVSIFGFGGLGKTTLSKAVYDKLKPGFDYGAFVLVGQKPDMKKVLRDILIDLDKQMYTNSNMMLLDERQLINELQEFLQKKRCFIVIDDIWDKKSWELIRCALQDSDCRSRVVATTRVFEVATHVGDVYRMKPLSHDESKKLLYTRIIDGKGKSIHSPSAEACDKILKKCDGVPLAIVTIASLLANKPRDEWPEVYDSIGLGQGGNDDVENTRRILSLSYYDLPLHLKPCLLYLSIFPEEYYIEKNLLIWKWIAEGLIHEEQASVIGLYEIGESYFNELINRSMIQPVEAEDKGYIDGCRVHDMMLDLIRLLSTEEKFVTILDESGKQQQLPRSNAPRLALHQNFFEEHNGDQLTNMRVEHLRSLLVSGCEGNFMLSPSFQVLRVLAIENRFIKNNYNTKGLQHVGSLLHLRYLGLQTSCTSELPKEVGDLKFLQVLDLLGTGIQELPESVGLLTKLLCLRASEGTRVSAGLIGKLTSLQEMCIWPSSDDTRQFVKALGKLRELRVLRTSINTYELDESVGRDLLESLRNLHKIQTVDIEGTSGTMGITWDVGFASPQRLQHLCLLSLEFFGLPLWIDSSLLNLTYLFLQVHILKEQDMETLGRLPELDYLKLYSHRTKIVSTHKSTFGNGYFPKLRFFSTPFWFVHFDLHGIMSRKNIIMPCLEYLEFTVHVQFLKDANNLASFDKLLSFENLGRASLRIVQAQIYCEDAHVRDVEEAEAALAQAVAVHPTHPSLRTTRQSEDGIRWT